MIFVCCNVLITVLPFNHVETVIKNSAQYHFDTIEQMLAFINQK